MNGFRAGRQVRRLDQRSDVRQLPVRDSATLNGHCPHWTAAYRLPMTDDRKTRPRDPRRRVGYRLSEVRQRPSSEQTRPFK